MLFLTFKQPTNCVNSHWANRLADILGRRLLVDVQECIVLGPLEGKHTRVQDSKPQTSCSPLALTSAVDARVCVGCSIVTQAHRDREIGSTQLVDPNAETMHQSCHQRAYMTACLPPACSRAGETFQVSSITCAVF